MPLRPLVLFALAGLAACTASTSSTTTPPPAAEAKPPAPEDAGTVAAARPEDPYLWLEEVTASKALDWARAQNARSEGELTKDARFATTRERLLKIYDSKEKIPMPEVRGKYIYNFWKDEAHKRGLWRRTSLAEYRKPSPAWEIVIDVDELARAEKENWVYKGASCLYPKDERCLVSLSRGGADATVVREFDTVKKAFVEGGFALPEAKSQVSWRDLDSIYVGTDFGPGSLTDSGYPRVAKLWKRGTPLAEATTLFEGKQTDVSVSATRAFTHGKAYDFVSRGPSFFTDETYVLGADGKTTKLDKPDDAEVDVWDDQLLIKLRRAWELDGKTWAGGSLLIIPFKDFVDGKRTFSALYEPSPRTSLKSYSGTKSGILVTELDDVKSRLYLHTRAKGGWKRTALDAPVAGSFTALGYDEDVSDDYWFIEDGFTTPTTLSLASIARKGRTPVKKNPAFFDAAGLEVTQHFATSRDGTKVPYFQIARAGLVLDGSAPTILYGYGGFEIALTPGYNAAAGSSWLERGGVYVQANIRGGGEYGPAWHQAALKQNRQRAYDDFIAVAEDLIARKVTSTPHLGINGGSNGGLLMGVMLTQRPDLFGAVVCQVPLLDMKRYHKLLAGASWMEEYGDPEKPEEWEALGKFSPYQNVKAGTTYPRTLFTTSTRDDRVHPGHARKMVARMLEQGHDVLYYENIEGGHGGAANNEQRAFMNALAYTFFARQLGLK